MQAVSGCSFDSEETFLEIDGKQFWEHEWPTQLLESSQRLRNALIARDKRWFARLLERVPAYRELLDISAAQAVIFQEILLDTVGEYY